MKSKTTIHDLRRFGDLLERKIFDDDSFAAIFSIYGEIWRTYVASNRKPGRLTLADERWFRFSERHYTTIVRCWNAYESKKIIDQICTEFVGDPLNADLLLRMHRELLAFYCNLGSAIDNMQGAFEVWPVECLAAFEEVRDSPNNDFNLKWFYDRRTQFVHSAIVPCFGEHGLLSVNLNLLDNKDTKWDNARPLKASELSGLIDLHWRYFADAINGAWSRLFDLLKSKSLPQPQTGKFVVQELEPCDLELGSGSPCAPYGSTVTHHLISVSGWQR